MSINSDIVNVCALSRSVLTYNGYYFRIQINNSLDLVRLVTAFKIDVTLISYLDILCTVLSYGCMCKSEFTVFLIRYPLFGFNASYTLKITYCYP